LIHTHTTHRTNPSRGSSLRATEDGRVQQHRPKVGLDITPEHHLAGKELGDKLIIRRDLGKLLVLEGRVRGRVKE
jgi:hypothetical protein